MLKKYVSVRLEWILIESLDILTSSREEQDNDIEDKTWNLGGFV
jgi:hypothetical protein